MKTQSTPTAPSHRRRHGFFALLGLGSLAWLIARTGSKPQRLTYPCQQAALAQTLGALWYLAPLLGAAHLLRRLRQRAGRLPAWAFVGAGLALALLTAGGDLHVPAPARAASGPLPGWTSATAVSDVFVVSDVPAPECSLDGGALPATAPCNAAAYALRDRGVDRLIEEMDARGAYFYQTATHTTGVIGANDVVVIKINNQWAGYGDGTGLGRLTTNTDVLKGVIWAILQHPAGFVGEVVVAENTQGVQGDWDLTPANSQDQNQSLQDVVSAFAGLGYAVSLYRWDDLNGLQVRGGSVSTATPAGEYAAGNMDDAYILLDDPAAASGVDHLSYPKFRTAGGRYVSMRYGIWNGTTYESSRLKLINMPVLKRHGMAGSTICWKNLVGFVSISDETRRFGGWDPMHGFFWGYLGRGDTDYGLVGREIAQIRTPDLNLVDAIWIGTQDNTGGPADRQDVVAASTDPFALDWYTSEYVLRNAVGDDGMGGNTAARGGTFRSATRVNQNSARLAWPGGAAEYPWIDLLDGYNGDTVNETERLQMNVYLASLSSTPQLSIGNAEVTEGASGPVPAGFVVTLSPASTETVTVNYATANGTATAGSDYEAASGSLTFAPGETTQPISVNVLGDALDESNETFLVALSGANAPLLNPQGVGTIADDDPAPSLAVADVAVTEGDAGTTDAVFTISLSEPSGRQVTAGWATANGTGVAPTDYTASSGTVTFSPGETTHNVTVPVRGDLLDEDDKTFFVNLTAAITNATALSNRILVDASHDGGVWWFGTPHQGAALAAYLQGRGFVVDEMGGGAITPERFALYRNVIRVGNYGPYAPDEIDVYRDFIGRGGSLLLLSEYLRDGETDELATQLGLVLAGIRQGSITRFASHPITAGVHDVYYRVGSVLSNAAGNSQIEVLGALDDGSPVMGLIQHSQAKIFWMGDSNTLEDLPQPLLDNLVPWAFGVAGAGDWQGQGTILDDDASPGLTVGDVTIVEGNAGTRNALLTARLAFAAGREATVTWQTADGTATSPADYTAASGTLTFPAGATTRTLVVPVLGDLIDEANETLTVNLSGALGATLVDPQALVTINDDDASPSLRIDDRSLPEGAGVNNLDLTVRLSAPSARPVTVNWMTSNGTATAPDDYASSSGTLSFAPGVVTQTVTIPCNGDNLVEPNEGLRVLLSGAVNATLAKPTGLLSFTNDDWLMQIANIVWSVRETPATLTLVVTRTGALGETVTVDYATSDRSATAGLDYQAAGGTLTFAPGVASQTFGVTILGDTLGEADETFGVALSNAVGSGTLGPKATGIVTILDDDAHVRLSSARYRVTEGGNALINVVRLGSTAPDLTVGYRTVTVTNGAAADDYTSASGTLTFRAGQMSATFLVPTINDNRDEGDEDVRLELTGAALGGAPFPLVAPTIATLTIVDNDAGGLVQLGAPSYSVREGGGQLTVSVLRSAGLAGEVTVDFSTVDASATSSGDYAATTTTLTFAAGELRKDVSIPITQDSTSEGHETFGVQLSNPGGGAELGPRSRVTVTILDDEPFVELALPDYPVLEGGTALPAFRRVNSTAAGVTVSYQVVPVTASGADYTVATPGTLTFAAGQLTKALPIVTTQDTLVEPLETLRVEITGAAMPFSVPASTATVTIRDNDRYAPTDIVFITEGTGFAPVIVLRAPATVLWTFDDGTTSDSPTPSKDYVTEARRVNRLRVTPWSALRRINIGYDAGDGGSGDIELVSDQRVSAVHNLSLVARYLEEWCSSYNRIEELSFDSFTALDTIECFLSSSLKKVSLRNTPRLRRACFEDGALRALDLSGSPALADLRGAQNDYPTLGLRVRHDATWHVCVRDNPQLTNRTLFSNTARFPRIAELFIWNTHQAGLLLVPSTSLTRDPAILAAGNAYTSADFRGAFRSVAGSGTIDLSRNRLTSLALAGCIQLRNLSVSNNPLSAAAVDSILEELEALGTSSGTADLSNTSPPTAVGLAHLATLTARGWTITVTP